MAHRQQGNAAKVVGYVRVSTDEQTLGPAAQRAALVRWCDHNNAELADVFEDIGVSGGTALDKRPGLVRALAALREHRAGVLLVAKRDRLARDVVLAAMVERLAERDGATVRAADGSGDGEGPEALLMRRIVDCFAEYERALIRARTRTALAVKRAKGERISREPSYGYRLTADGHVVADEAEQRTVAMIAELRGTGRSLHEIADALDASGICSRTGRRFHPQTIARIAGAAPHAVRVAA